MGRQTRSYSKRPAPSTGVGGVIGGILLSIVAVTVLGPLQTTKQEQQRRQQKEQQYLAQLRYDLQRQKKPPHREKKPDPKPRNPSNSHAYAGDYSEDKYGEDECKDLHPQCGPWAMANECDANPSYMLTNCPRSCHTCHMLDPKVRCKRNESLTAGVSTGGVDKMFRRIVADFPELGPEALSEDPWVLYLHNFMSDDEVSALINSFADAGLEFSPSIEKDSAINQDRTRRNSESMMCNVDKCWNDPRVLKIHDRVEAMTQLPLGNQEFVQLLRYKAGQFYVRHHDTSNAYTRMPCGHRIYTLFLYLSDVSGGGETHFPALNIQVKPKKGAAVLWANVLNNNVKQVDSRTEHEAFPVKHGEKLAANMWLYQYDFRSPWRIGCTNF